MDPRIHPSPMPTSSDVAVQHTNDDSVVSKRSAGKMGYVSDDYLRHFVKKLARRSPLINRGYYLRIVAMTDVVIAGLRSFRSADHLPAPQRRQVLSLGAGFDTLAARCFGITEFSDVYFFEVDFPAVIANKSGLMAKAGLAQSFPFGADVRITDTGNTIAPRYCALGCDLRDVGTALAPLLSAHGFDFDAPTVVYAECVMQYMPPDASSRVIEWVVRHLPRAIFSAYDQINPQDAFGGVMTGTLKSKASPLLGTARFQGEEQLRARAFECGLSRVAFADFFRVSAHHLAVEERRRVEALEPFDELEEWSEMCDHYGILVGCTPGLETPLPRHPPLLELPRVPHSPSSPGIVRAVHRPQGTRISNWPVRFAFEGWGHAVVSEPLGADTGGSAAATAIICFGGFLTSKGHARTSALHCHVVGVGDVHVIVRGGLAAAPPPVAFHSMVRVSPGAYIIYGGRGSPTAASSDAWLMTVDFSDLPGPSVTASFQRLVNKPGVANSEDLPSARYRHVAAAVPGADRSASGAEEHPCARMFIHGGFSGPGGAALGDSWIATLDVDAAELRWSRIAWEASGSHQLPPLASAAAATLPRGEGILLCGGLTSVDSCTGALWIVHPARQSCRELRHSITPRFSHAMTVTDSGEVIVLGGNAMCPKATWQEHTLVAAPLAQLVAAGSSSECPWRELPLDATVSSGDGSDGIRPPTWTRHALVSLGASHVAVIGGGFTCFSFGTYSTKPMLITVATDPAATALPTWFLGAIEDRVAAADSPSTGEAASPQSVAASAGGGSKGVKRVKQVREAALSADTWKAALGARQPRHFRAVDLGSCLSSWASPQYLEQKQGNTVVSVHVSLSKRLDFLSKNFTFRHVSFGDLIRHSFAPTSTTAASGTAAVADAAGSQRIEPKDGHSSTTATSQTGTAANEIWYFRSVGENMRTERADFWRDFSGIAQDFGLPPVMKEHIVPRLHQSCFRINRGGVHLWMHYDTMDNVLCQIVGRKRVVLFPPSQLPNLYVTGSSSRILDVDHLDMRRFPRFAEARRHAVEVLLEPGSVLLIPALWFHSITSIDDSISVNVFFEHLSHDSYDPLDLYANRDLPAASALRSQIVAAARSCIERANVPEPYRSFAILQAIGDMEELAKEMQ